MTDFSNDAADDDNQLEDRAWSGDEAAMAELFDRFRPRLRQIVSARLDNRLKGRVDASDVLQEAYIELARKLPSLPQKRSEQATPMSMFVLMRLVTTERVVITQRRHMEAEGRDVRREKPQSDNSASSIFLAEHLLAVFGSAENKLLKSEMFEALKRTLEGMDPIDHEIIMMRRFEELSNIEAAEVLGIAPTTASTRFVRAMTRLKKQLETIPGFQ